MTWLSVAHFGRYFKILTVVTLCLFAVEKANAQGTHLDIPPRLQWNANYGYCGEVSFISAGLYYGQYCSQFTARQLASSGAQQSRANSQLLLGVNDAKAAKAMHLSATPWKGSARSRSPDFLAWVKSQVMESHPVIIGVFMNQYLFYDTTSPTAGDSDYDHIVPVFAVSGDSSLTFSDNGLWSPKEKPPYIFSYPFDEFQCTRREANERTGPIYSLKSDGKNYGIAIDGVLDLSNNTIPVHLKTNVNYEKPEMQNRSSVAPASAPITLTVTVEIPDQNVAYNLYRYNDFKKVPDNRFNYRANMAAAVWKIPSGVGPQYVLTVNIQSNEVAAFRAVKATAP